MNWKRFVVCFFAFAVGAGAFFMPGRRSHFSFLSHRSSPTGQKKSVNVTPARSASAREVAAPRLNKIASPAPACASARACKVGLSVPVTFEPNVGQSSPGVEFLGRGKGLTVFLTHSEIAVELAGHSQQSATAQKIVTMRLAWRDKACPAASCATRPERFAWQGNGKLTAVSNYFIGRDPRLWHTRVPHFARVEAPLGPTNFRQSTVGAVVYGSEDGIEYDLRFAPGADASRLRLNLSGADSVRLEKDGDLLLLVGGAQLRMRKPLIYEDWGASENSSWAVPGPADRRPVDGAYRIYADGSIGFQVGPHDPHAALVVDPSLTVSYASFLGGTGAETAAGLALDSQGNIYLAGTTTSSSSFPDTVSARLGSGSGQSQFYIAKINPAVTGTSSLLYLTFLGGSGAQAGGQIAVDSSGDIAVTGATTSADFPVTDGSQPTVGLTGGTGNDLIVSELDPTGATLLYSTLFGGSGAESQNGTGGIAIGPSGNIFMASDTTSADLLVTAGAYQTSFQSPYSNGFLAEFDPASATLIYCSYLGTNSSANVSVGGIAVDAFGDAYIVGASQNMVSGFPSTSGAIQSTYGGGTSDAFLMKISPGGQGTSDLIYATLLGGSGLDAANAVAVDASIPPLAYITGTTQSTNFPVNGANTAYQSSSHISQAVTNSSNAFLTVVAQDPVSNSTFLAYSTYLGGSEVDSGQALAAPSGDSVYIIGTTTSVDFPWHDNLQAFNGSSDAFVAKFDTTVSGAASLIYSTPLGGTFPPAGAAGASGAGIASNGDGFVYVAGQTTEADFPTAVSTDGSVNGFQQTCASCQLQSPASDAFVAALEESSQSTPSVYFYSQTVPMPVNFPPTPIGSASAPQPMGLYNGGEAPLEISAIQTLGPNASDFFVEFDDSCLGVEISAGAVLGCSFEVYFSPSVAGPETAVVAVTDNAPGSPQLLELTGSGEGPQHAIVSPALLAFGTQPIHTTATLTVTVTNSGTEPLTIYSISGLNSAVFAFGQDTCPVSSAVPLGPLSSCTIPIAFTPTATGSFSSQIMIQDNSDLNTDSEQTVQVNGTGTESAPIIEFAPPSMALSFGTINVGASSGPQQVSLTNSGSAALTVSSISLSGANVSDFQIASTGTTCPLSGGLVAIGASCTVMLRFAPQAVGASENAVLTFSDNAAGSPQQVSLSGTATAAPDLQVSPASVTFAAQSTGTTSAAQIVTILNAGSATASIPNVSLSGTNAGDFAVTNPCAPTLAASKSCQLSVTFQPQLSGSPGPRSATLNIASGTPSTVSLSGEAVQSSISIAPSNSSISFGSAAEGTRVASGNAVTLQVTDNSTGTYAGALAVSSVVVTGANSADFALGTDSCLNGTTAPGATCTIQITFAPACINAPANRVATLVLTDNAPGSPQRIALSGTATGDFCFAPVAAQTVASGSTATFTLELFSANNFTGSISLSCSGAPSEGTCTPPSEITVGQQFSVTVATTAASTSSFVIPPAVGTDPLLRVKGRFDGWPAPGANSAALLLAAALLLLALLPARRSASKFMQCSALILAIAIGLAACGSSSSDPGTSDSGTPSGTYAITVTGTDTNSITRTATLNLSISGSSSSNSDVQAPMPRQNIGEQRRLRTP